MEENEMGKHKDEPITDAERRSVERWAFNRAAEKDARSADGRSDRVNFLLSEKNKK
jgi:hypothetical protein